MFPSEVDWWICWPCTRNTTLDPFDETDYDSKYFHVNEINTFLKDLTRPENLSRLHLSIRGLRSNLDDFHTLLEESKHPFNVISLTETWLNDHEFKTNSNYRLPNTTEFIMKGKLTKEEVGFLCVLGMTSRIKFETIYVVLIAIEKFSQLNYSQKA